MWVFSYTTKESIKYLGVRGKLFESTYTRFWRLVELDENNPSIILPQATVFIFLKRYPIGCSKGNQQRFTKDIDHRNGQFLLFLSAGDGKKVKVRVCHREYVKF